ncbi:MAG: hypothetical protein IJR85_06495 [Synergistaceae bacterium]|nr:hypothetical protein [Synergistaceae bacterium]
MSYIIVRKIRNASYVYECTSYRNKEGKPRNKQHCIGKLDSDGVLISSKRKLPVQIKEVKTVTRKFILVPYSPQPKRTDTPVPAKTGQAKTSPIRTRSGIKRRVKRMPIVFWSYSSKKYPQRLRRGNCSCLNA